MDEVLKVLEKLSKEYQDEMISADSKTKRVYCKGAKDALNVAIRKIYMLCVKNQ